MQTTGPPEMPVQEAPAECPVLLTVLRRWIAVRRWVRRRARPPESEIGWTAAITPDERSESGDSLEHDDWDCGSGSGNTNVFMETN